MAFQSFTEANNMVKRNEIKLGEFVIAAGVGIMVTLVALSAHSQKLFHLSHSIIKKLSTEAGGGNIVNVILVDYRGFDTLFEIAVLGDCWYRCI